MAAVGFDLYCQLLAQAIQELKGEEPEQFELPPADLPMDAYIPTDYIPLENQRLSFYKKMTAVRDRKDIDQVGEEMQDRFGDLPTPVANSLEILGLRLKAAQAGAASISTDRRQVVIKFGSGIRLAADVALDLKKRFSGNVFLADRVITNALNPRLMELLNDIMDAIPEALEESKAVYLARL
jgi:transcription-repair coupling factor (superfamily II helicase)